jgi:hypothetical protein
MRGDYGDVVEEKKDVKLRAERVEYLNTSKHGEILRKNVILG